MPTRGRFEPARFTDRAGSRDYKLYIPSGDRGSSLPLVVMLHGCTQSPDDFAAGTRMNLRAEEDGFFVVYPAQSRSANCSQCWNWFRESDQKRDEGEPSLIAGITRRVIEQHEVDPARVYIAGLSSGGAAAATMAAEYPDLYAALGVHSGLAHGAARDVVSAFAAMQRGRSSVSTTRHRGCITPTIVFHGEQDRTVHPRNGDQVVSQSKESVGDLALETRREDGQIPGGHAYRRTIHTLGERIVFEQWLVHGAGHAWAGGSAAGSYTDPKGPDATRAMLRFFAASHRA